LVFEDQRIGSGNPLRAEVMCVESRREHPGDEVYSCPGEQCRPTAGRLRGQTPGSLLSFAIERVMLVRDVMRSPAVSVSAGTSLQDAYRTMREKNIRHLPVLDGGRLVGVVTDRDLRLATSSLAPDPFPADSEVSRVMSRRPLTAASWDPVEDAARVMRTHKIGCLPIVDDDQLIGIITGLDLLDALIRMTGADKPSARIEVRLPDQPGELARLTALLGSRGANIHSILTYPDGERSVRTVLRVGSMDTRVLAADLRQAAFAVLWPPDRPCPR
jgi:acetoin utilization protein AcuB